MDQLPVKSEVWWDESEQILHIVSHGNFEKKDAVDQYNKIEQIAREHGGTIVRGLANLEDAGRASIQAQIIFSDLMKSNMIKYEAFVDMKPVTKYLLKLVVQLSETTNQIKFFDSEAEAIAWLKTCR